MAYKILGFVVWQGAKIFLNRTTPNYVTGRRAGLAVLVGVGIVGALVATNRSNDSSNRSNDS
jgi:hypothetical protein